MDRKILSLFVLGIPLICLLFFISVTNRAFAFGFSVSLLFSASVLYRLKPKVVVAFSCVLFAFLLLLAFFLKRNSTDGRLLIYKISLAMLKDSWPSGTGTGSFKSEYLFAQAKYFATQGTVEERLLADNTYFAFNDYLEFVIENGAFGLLALLVGIGLTRYIIIKAIRNKKRLGLAIVVSGLLFALLVAPIFTHVFQNIYLQMLACILAIALAFIAFEGASTIFIPIGGCSALLIFVFVFFARNRQDLAFNEAYLLYTAGEKKAALELLDSGIFSSQPKAICLRRQILIDQNSLKNINYIEQLLREYPDAEGYKQVGDIYAEHGEALKAEKAYSLAINMVPNRFAPRYALFRFYAKVGNHMAATRVAIQGVELPVKIPSKAVTQIRSEFEKFLTKTDK